MPEKIVVFGAGGHAKVVIDTLEREGKYTIAFLADADPSRFGSSVLGYPVRKEEDGFAAPSEGIAWAFVAIGSNTTRRRIAGAAVRMGLALATTIHPSAIVAPTARIGAGTLVMPGAIINADARIGANVIVNSGAIVEHDCVIGEDVHIAPNATLCGGVAVGAGTLVGAGATLLPCVGVGAGVSIGAGSTVLADLPDGVTATGSPCRILEKKA